MQFSVEFYLGPKFIIQKSIKEIQVIKLDFQNYWVTLMRLVWIESDLLIYF